MIHLFINIFICFTGSLMGYLIKANINNAKARKLIAVKFSRFWTTGCIWLYQPCIRRIIRSNFRIINQIIQMLLMLEFQLWAFL